MGAGDSGERGYLSVYCEGIEIVTGRFLTGDKK